MRQGLSFSVHHVLKLTPRATMAHTITLNIYYEDTDAGGVVYYANYLRYMERARTEFLRDRGIDVHGWHREGMFFVVSHVDISYRRPAVLGDTVEVTTEVSEIKNASLGIRNGVWRDGTLLVEALVTLVCVDADYRPRRFPAGFRERLSS